MAVSLKRLSPTGVNRLRDAIKRAFADEITRRTGEPHEYEYYFAKPERRWRSDIAFPGVKVAVEIDGGTWGYGRHNRAGSILADMEKGNGYSVRGWLVFHCPWEWIDGGKRDRSAQLINDISQVVKSRMVA